MNLIETLELKDQQPEAATTRGRDLSVNAGAGSGKTKTLVARYLSLLDEQYPPRSIVAITFTKKAAREMRNRIRQAIQDWLAGDCPPAQRDRWRQIEADIDTARIGTIHSLCESILRAHPAEASVDPGFGVLDEGLAAALRAQVVEDALDWANQQSALLPIFDAFETRALEEIVGTLLEKRLDAARALDETDLLAKWDRALGSKLSDFANQVGEGITELAELARGDLITDAGDKLAEQVTGLLSEWSAFQSGLSAERGHSIQAAQHLFTVRRDHCDGRTGKKTSRAKTLVKEFREGYDESVDPWLGGANKKDPPPDLTIESRTANTLPFLKAVFAHALEDYQAAKDLQHDLDFDDLEAKALALLRNPEIRARWQSQIDALLVDEFQDTNERQREIVEALAGTSDGKVGRLFVVGDAKQSIYRFRGADVGVFRQLDQTIRERGGLPLTLNRTFRAHNGLVNALNEILETVMVSASRYAVPFTPLTAERVSPKTSVTEPYLEFLYGLGDSTDVARASAANLLAQRLTTLRAEEKISWDRIALLFRASTGFPEYEQALELAGIPFVTVAGKGFYDRPEIRDVLNILRALADPWDDLALAGLLRSPAFGVSDEGLYRMRWSTGGDQPVPYRMALSADLSYLSEADRHHAARSNEIVARLTKMVERVSVAELLKQVLDTTLYPAILSAEGTGVRLQRNIDKLLSDAQASGIVRVSEFLEYIETLREAGAREGEAPSEASGAVRLMTIHKAKGLQFPVVVIADASRGRPPLKEPALLSTVMGLVPNPDRFDNVPLCFRLAQAIEREQAEAEDLRLLYVAATRAEEKLIVCGHQRDHHSSGWLDQLASAASLDLGAMCSQPGAWQIQTLPGSQQTVRGIAQAVQSQKVDVSTKDEKKVETSNAIPLYAPLVSLEMEQGDEKQKEGLDNRRRLRRVVGRHRRPEGTTLGTLVHAALRHWRFPGDAGLDELLRAEALMEGLVDQAEREVTLAQAKEILGRFRADPRCGEITSAPERRHEVPYSILGDSGLPVMGVIDLIYRGRDRAWRIVDFKTDDIQNDAQFLELMKKYSGQVIRYRENFQRLSGHSGEAWLCFLNYGSTVRWEQIP
jgi:ATP-dependent helicase/nuclease subunit A